MRINGALSHEVGHGADRIRLTGYFADPEYLSMFSFPLLNGDPATALGKPNTMVITESTAAKLFGEKDPMGEMVFIEPFGEVMVTGVAKNTPKNII